VRVLRAAAGSATASSRALRRRRQRHRERQRRRQRAAPRRARRSDGCQTAAASLGPAPHVPPRLSNTGALPSYRALASEAATCRSRSRTS
jgi:hypothetical protein